jgi:Cof subfamily protein (haloacid dehalogenase superfamily)
MVCDMDGTILDSAKRLSSRTLSAIRAAESERGVATTVCSGRVCAMMGLYVKKLGLKIPFISSNGGAIVDPGTDEVLFQMPLPKDEASALMDFCGRNGFDYCALGPEGGFFSPFSPDGECIKRFNRYNLLSEADGVRPMPLYGIGGASSAVLHKILIFRGDGVTPRVEAFLSGLPGLSYTMSDVTVMDVMAAGVNKGEGVAHLAKIMGVAREHVCVFGDYTNDLPMFREAGTSVAMGNACDEAKAAADFVTASNNDDGVAEFIEKYILNTK